MNTRIINLYGGPCTRKSTIAASIFSILKSAQINCELVTEYAKEITYENKKDLSKQCKIFSEQMNRLDRFVDKVDYIITDSPLLLSIIYQPKNYPTSFSNLVLEFYKRYNNINFLLKRSDSFYEAAGRNEQLNEAIELDNKIFNLLTSSKLMFHIVENKIDATEKIISLVLNK